MLVKFGACQLAILHSPVGGMPLHPPWPPAFPPICGTGAIRSGEDTANQISAMLSAKRG